MNGGPFPGLVGLEVRCRGGFGGHIGSPASLLPIFSDQTGHRGKLGMVPQPLRASRCA